MMDTSKLKQLNKGNKGGSINNFDNKVQDNQLGKDLWDLYEIFQEIGLPEKEDQID